MLYKGCRVTLLLLGRQWLVCWQHYLFWPSVLYALVQRSYQDQSLFPDQGVLAAGYRCFRQLCRRQLCVQKVA